MSSSSKTVMTSISIVCYIVTALVVGYMYVRVRDGTMGDYGEVSGIHLMVIFSLIISGITFYISRGINASLAAICLSLNLTVLLVESIFLQWR